MNLASVPREYLEVPLAHIDEPVRPARGAMDDDRLDELTTSIQANGLLQPLIVARVGERFEVVAGHRRRIACQRAGLMAAPCIVYPSKDVALEAIKYAENRHREELSAADEAIWFMELLEGECEGDTDRLAALLHEKRGYVEGRIALFAGDPQVFEALQVGKITIGVAQQLNRCTQELYRRHLLDQAIVNGATVAIVNGWIAEWKRVMEPALRNVNTNADAVTSGVAFVNDYFTCHLCTLKENPGDMRPIQMHTYCIQAVLTPALKFFQHRDRLVERPRTLEDARELVNDLVDLFPALADPSGN